MSERFDLMDDVIQELKAQEARTMATTTHSAKVTLPADTQILITREFDAPRAPGVEGVHHAGADRALVGAASAARSPASRWTCGSAARWRYVMTANGGFEVAFHGEYREISPTDRLVNTEIFEGAPGGRRRGHRRRFTESTGGPR